MEKGKLKVVVNDYGAELTSILVNGVERLWQNENGTWAGHAPVFFPACGLCKVVVDGKEYPQFRHGFAQYFTFEVTEQADDLLRFTLKSNEETKKYYPYDFVLHFIYKIVNGDTLVITHEAYNPAETPMYCAFGGHESFLLDKNLGAYEVRFEKEEKFRSLTITGSFMDGGFVDLGAGKTFALDEKFFVNSETAIFEKIQSRKVTLAEIGGEAVADVAFDGFDNLLFWRPEDAKTICIEPWHNLPDNEAHCNDEFATKEGIFTVPPKQTLRFERTIKYYK
jgi:galactose mutarotase-like enzyme